MREVLCKMELDELTVTKIPVSVCHGKGEMITSQHILIGIKNNRIKNPLESEFKHIKMYIAVGFHFHMLPEVGLRALRREAFKNG